MLVQIVNKLVLGIRKLNGPMYVLSDDDHRASRVKQPVSHSGSLQLVDGLVYAHTTYMYGVRSTYQHYRLITHLLDR